MKVCAILGASGAIGTALAQYAANRGWSVLALARGIRRPDLPWRALSDFATPEPASVQWIRCNAVQRHDLQLFFQRTKHLQLDALSICHAVGIPPDVNLELADYPETAWEETFDSYVNSPMRLFQEVCHCQRAASHIVFMGSAITRFQTAELPPFHAGHYAAAKAALDEFCKWAQREAHKHNFLLSRISPSAVETDFHKRGQLGARPAKMVPMEKVCRTVLGLWNGTKDEFVTLI